MTHYHSCPKCYQDIPCEMDCSIEDDLKKDNKKFGSYAICDECEITKPEILLSKEWWSKYTGVK
jgi:hypothetical protein